MRLHRSPSSITSRLYSLSVLANMCCRFVPKPLLCLCVFLSLFSRSTRGLNWRRCCFPLGPVGGGERPGASGAPKTGWVKAASRPYPNPNPAASSSPHRDVQLLCRPATWPSMSSSRLHHSGNQRCTLGIWVPSPTRSMCTPGRNFFKRVTYAQLDY